MNSYLRGLRLWKECFQLLKISNRPHIITTSVNKASSVERLRLDIWLDIACVCKTRSAAKLACQGGKISVNGDRAKPHRYISAGDKIIITEARGRKRHLLVSSLTAHRITRMDAKILYVDVTPPPTEDELELQDMLRRAGPSPGSGQGVPSRRERRFRRRAKGRI